MALSFHSPRDACHAFDNWNWQRRASSGQPQFFYSTSRPPHDFECSFADSKAFFLRIAMYEPCTLNHGVTYVCTYTTQKQEQEPRSIRTLVTSEFLEKILLLYLLRVSSFEFRLLSRPGTSSIGKYRMNKTHRQLQTTRQQWQGDGRGQQGTWNIWIGRWDGKRWMTDGLARENPSSWR